MEGKMIEIQIDQTVGKDGRQFILRKGDVRFCHTFTADEWDLATKDKVFWCMLLGLKESETTYPEPVLLVMKQIDGSTEFERVGYADHCGYWSRKAISFFDEVKRTHVTVL